MWFKEYFNSKEVVNIGVEIAEKIAGLQSKMKRKNKLGKEDYNLIITLFEEKKHFEVLRAIYFHLKIDIAPDKISKTEKEIFNFLITKKEELNLQKTLFN